MENRNSVIFPPAQVRGAGRANIVKLGTYVVGLNKDVPATYPEPRKSLIL
jgi:hypothetical protein